LCPPWLHITNSTVSTFKIPLLRKAPKGTHNSNHMSSQRAIFYIFVHNKSFLKILPDLNLLQSLELTFFRGFISENLRLPLIFLVQVLLENLSKWHHFLKKTTPVEIIITITTLTAILIKNNKKSSVLKFMQFSTLFSQWIKHKNKLRSLVLLYKSIPLALMS